MARIMGIDYGTKRVGIAVTDPLQIIASSLATVPTAEIFDFLKKYLSEEAVECIVVGEPLHEDGNPAQVAPAVDAFVRRLQELFPAVQIVRQDERYSSVEARRYLLQSGVPKMKRRDKTLVDKLSAAIILEDYMKAHRW